MCRLWLSPIPEPCTHQVLQRTSLPQALRSKCTFRTTKTREVLRSRKESKHVRSTTDPHDVFRLSHRRAACLFHHTFASESRYDVLRSTKRVPFTSTSTTRAFFNFIRVIVTRDLEQWDETSDKVQRPVPTSVPHKNVTAGSIATHA